MNSRKRNTQGRFAKEEIEPYNLSAQLMHQCTSGIRGQSLSFSFKWIFVVVIILSPWLFVIKNKAGFIISTTNNFFEDNFSCPKCNCTQPQDDF